MVGLMFLSSCECRSVCSCLPVNFYIEYHTNDNSCNDIAKFISVDAYDKFSNELLIEELHGYIEGCTVSIAIDANNYWVITADTLNITDTLKIENFEYRVSTDPCCSCRYIESILFSVNDESYSEAEITRLY